MEELVIECLKNNIIVRGVEWNGKNLEYIISGFSKSDIAVLTLNGEGKTILKTRYNRIDEIETFEDIAMVAYDWYISYRNREPFTYPDCNWEPIFKRLGLLK